MPFSTIGDLRQHFLTSQTNTKLKTELGTLVQELTTGEKSDLTDHLGAQQTSLTGLDRQLSMLDRFAQSNTQTAQMLSSMQTILSNVDDMRSTASSTLMTINEASTPDQIFNAADVARNSFDSAVRALNTRYGDRALFGGNNVDDTPLASADDMLVDLRAAVTGLTSEDDISATIDDWFDSAGGGFETLGYQGDDTGVMSRPVDANQDVSVDLRADDTAIRDVLKALAKGVIAADHTMGLADETARDLQLSAGVDLLAAATPMAGVQSRIGYAEGQVEEAAVRISAQQTSYGIARNDLVSADPFETASRLESVQLQLETHYTLTARLSRLSLTEYLR